MLGYISNTMKVKNPLFLLEVIRIKIDGNVNRKNILRCWKKSSFPGFSYKNILWFLFTFQFIIKINNPSLTIPFQSSPVSNLGTFY